MANDGSQASHQAAAELKAEGILPAQTLVRTNKYLNNMIEQDHRKVSVPLRSRISLANSKSSNFNGFQSGYLEGVINFDP
jgi:transposase-like protein